MINVWLGCQATADHIVKVGGFEVDATVIAGVQRPWVERAPDIAVQVFLEGLVGWLSLRKRIVRIMGIVRIMRVLHFGLKDKSLITVLRSMSSVVELEANRDVLTGIETSIRRGTWELKPLAEKWEERAK